MYGLDDTTTRNVERTLILINKRALRASFGESRGRVIGVTMRRSGANPAESAASSLARFLS